MSEQPEQVEPEITATDAPAPTPVPDEVLLDAVDLARRALLEATRPETVGSVVGHVVEDDHVLTLLFASDLSGYPGWHWSVTIARVEGAEPTVLETELMPGETALLAPEWVPWSERLADYRAAQEAAAATAAETAGAAAGDGEADEDELADEDDADLDDDAELDAAFGQDAGDDAFDGIDIDSFDDSADDDESDDDGDAEDGDAEDDGTDDDDAQSDDSRS
ncbi:DUF3027 domain-containing protein [Agromyces sp. H66]|uniref:DUF3027 domain-containing protein n=1 Tax=Agromyces sp. H66 TaxID=2529859 RepID=UPI0010AA50C0|nr:DUF3027 domain-containing protein [Agromyces sp. H66]